MSSPLRPTRIALAERQEQILHLDAGTEVRCISGSLHVRLGFAGLAYRLSAGQALRLPDTQWVAVIGASGAASLTLEAAASAPARTEKNRQGLSSLWRSLAARLMVRRGPHGA